MDRFKPFFVQFQTCAPADTLKLSLMLGSWGNIHALHISGVSSFSFVIPAHVSATAISVLSKVSVFLGSPYLSSPNDPGS